MSEERTMTTLIPALASTATVKADIIGRNSKKGNESSDYSQAAREQEVTCAGCISMHIC